MNQPISETTTAPTGLARVENQWLQTLPTDLYIPPDALEIFLETFEGPLDLLLYLIQRQNLDILNIPIALITKQYMEYIELMQETQLELAAEYLVMAATLTEIKSRLLLPRPAIEEIEEADPRLALIRRLQLYQQLKRAADDLDELPRCERDVHPIQVDSPKVVLPTPLPEVNLQQLLAAWYHCLQQADLTEHHRIEQEPLSIRERMATVLQMLQHQPRILFAACCRQQESRQGIVVTFIAMLELLKQAFIVVEQTHAFAPIYLSLRTEGSG